MAPELAPDIEVVEIKSPDSPEEVVGATRGCTGKVLIKVLKAGGGMAFLALLASCSPDGSSEVEQKRQAVWETTNTALCTKKAANPNPAGTVINQIETDEDEVVDGGGLDLANIPSEAKKFVWGKYALEWESDYVNGGGDYGVYTYDSNMEKEKMGELTIEYLIQFVTQAGYVKSGSTVYLIQEIDGILQDTEIGELPVGGSTTHKEETFLIFNIDEQTNDRKLAAIDPSNPSQILKNIILQPEQSPFGSTGIDYDSTTGTLSVAVENKIYIYKNLPEGIDWMDDADNYLEYMEVVGNDVQKIYTISGYTFAVNGSEIIVISPVGQVHSINTDDMSGSTFQSFEKIGGRLHVVGAPSFSVAPWPNPLNPDFPYLITEDPGADSSNYSHCAATTPEFIGLITPPINPDTIEDDAYVYDDVYDALEEIGVDTEIYPDIDPADVLPDTPIEDIPIEDVQPDTPIEDVQPDLPPPDVQPDTPADTPIEDVQPDLPPPDVQPDTPADIPIDTSFDIEDTDTPADLIQETFDTLDLLADTQFDEFTPDNKTPETIQPETTNPDVPADAPNPDKPEPDNKPDPQDNEEGDTLIVEETDPPKGGGNGCSTSDDPGNPLGPLLVLTGMGAGAVALRRKEDDPVPTTEEKASAKKAKAA
jgi:hypothetical protein